MRRLHTTWSSQQLCARHTQAPEAGESLHQDATAISARQEVACTVLLANSAWILANVAARGGRLLEVNSVPSQGATWIWFASMMTLFVLSDDFLRRIPSLFRWGALVGAIMLASVAGWQARVITSNSLPAVLVERTLGHVFLLVLVNSAAIAALGAYRALDSPSTARRGTVLPVFLTIGLLFVLPGILLGIVGLAGGEEALLLTGWYRRASYPGR